MNKWLKASGIGVAAIVISTLGIQASDEWSDIDSNLRGLLGDTVISPCSDGAVLLQFSQQSLCVDAFEASPAPDCPHVSTENQLHTSANLAQSDCTTVSISEVLPWRFVSLAEAQQLCARTGKRLPTTAEWYRLALMVPEPDACVVNERSVQETGSQLECTSAQGIADLVGNVWEWTDALVTDGVYEDRRLPSSGYVLVVDNDGIVVQTTTTPQQSLGNDFAYTDSEGLYGVLRGSFFSGGDDAGVYAQKLDAPLDLRTTGVGFRCVQDV